MSWKVYCIISDQIISYRVISYHVISCHILMNCSVFLKKCDTTQWSTIQTSNDQPQPSSCSSPKKAQSSSSPWWPIQKTCTTLAQEMQPPNSKATYTFLLPNSVHSLFARSASVLHGARHHRWYLSVYTYFILYVSYYMNVYVWVLVH